MLDDVVKYNVTLPPDVRYGGTPETAEGSSEDMWGTVTADPRTAMSAGNVQGVTTDQPGLQDRLWKHFSKAAMSVSYQIFFLTASMLSGLGNVHSEKEIRLN